MGGFPCPCMTLRNGSILIAIIEIVCSAIGMVAYGLSVGGLVYVRSLNDQSIMNNITQEVYKEHPEMKTESKELDSDTFYVLLMVIIGGLCVLSVLQFIFGTVLLFGIRREKITLVRMWLFFKLLCLALGIILTLTSVVLERKWNSVGSVVGDIFATLIGIYIIYVVYCYYQDLYSSTQARPKPHVKSGLYA